MILVILFFVLLFLWSLGPRLRLWLRRLAHLGLGRRRLAHLGRTHWRRLPLHLRLGLGLPLYLWLSLWRRPVHLGLRLDRRLLLLC